MSDSARATFPGCFYSDEVHRQTAKSIENEHPEIWDALVAMQGDIAADEEILNKSFRLAKEHLPQSSLVDISRVILMLRMDAYEAATGKHVLPKLAKFGLTRWSNQSRNGDSCRF
jgi:hypothetical protein